MKYIKISIAVITAILVVFVWHSCSKENIEPANASEEISKINPQHDGVTAKLSAFVKEAGSKQLFAKDGETMEPQNALWYIEGAVNYMNARKGEPFEDVLTDTIIFTLTANADGNIYKTQIFDAFFEVYNFSQNFFNSLENGNKFILAVDVTELSFENNIYKFNAICLVAIGIAEETDKDRGFTESWWYGLDEGTCSGSLKPRDAASELQRVTNAVQYQPRPGYYTDIDTAIAEFYEFINPNGDEDNYKDYLIYASFADINDHHLCISAEEMDFYSAQIRDSIIVAKRPTTAHKFINIFIEDDTESNNAWHIYYLRFGKIHFPAE